jgi:hypothetical protein
MKKLIFSFAAAMSVSAQAQDTASQSPTTIETVAPPAASQPRNAMRLICRGTGERSVMGLSWGSAFSGRHSASFVGGSSQLSQFGEQMDIDIDGSVAKARVPRRFLPPAHGGEGGWFAVKDLVITDDAITGKVAINFAQHPNLRIDRRSGSVALDGKVGSFAGQCEKLDPNARAF